MKNSLCSQLADLRTTMLWQCLLLLLLLTRLWVAAAVVVRHAKFKRKLRSTPVVPLVYMMVQ